MRGGNYRFNSLPQQRMSRLKVEEKSEESMSAIKMEKKEGSSSCPGLYTIRDDHGRPWVLSGFAKESLGAF